VRSDADRYVERELSASDVESGLALSRAAGWNQTAEDWRYLLRAGRGFGIDASGRLVATAMTVPYGARFGWISMVLVDEHERGRGLATRLMRRCIGALRERGTVPILDATPAGREVYLRLGFRDAYSLRRLRRMQPGSTTPGDDHVEIVALAEADLPAVAALDRDAFGADREPLLRALRARVPGAAVVARRDGTIAGFALARDGMTATQIGPVVADDPALGATLVQRALGAVDSPVLIDVPDRHVELRARLVAAGFGEERPFTRMVHERDGAFDRPERIFAIAGPELG
jgi:GNAT superfamily N-acetyltransferase